MDQKNLDKVFHFANIEQNIYQRWEGAGAFRARNPLKPLSNAPAYTIMIPPPNITGSLHMGHALNNTLQDILVRYHRLKNFETHWQPGTDHASIATQQVVEKKLALEQTTRHQLGREKFLKRVWEWKAESGGVITQQLRRLGASPDWHSERFTMDEGLSKAVNRSFVELYNAGLIYKAKRMVNWDPKMETAISDLEVVPTQVPGKLYYLRYPLVAGGDITIATTRPETLLGDTAVAVHPDDERYQQYIGKKIKQPITGRELIIIADDMVERTAGSGALKVTPAADPNDFKLYQKHKIPLIEIFDKSGHLLTTSDIPEKYQGMERFAARKEIVKDLEAAGILSKIEDITHTVPYGDRGGVPVEYLLTEQWFVKADVLAPPALDAVKQGKIKFLPEAWAADYYRWLENIEPWCISRQLWWGHRIPAFYAPDGKIFVAEDITAAEKLASEHYGTATTLTQDSDVLDTWFSSALWPFSTLGWPEKTAMLQRHYPTNVLVTGFDIIFFWVARMVMMGLYFMKDIPFDTVYVHPLVRDEKGQKMSKSKGNIIDPLDLIDEFGADAIRFTLTALSSPGRDIKLSQDRIKGYRNFITKLWNAARFCGLLLGDNIGTIKISATPPAAPLNPINGWMLQELAQAVKQCEQHLADYRFDYYANGLHHMVWHEFCDWYLEMIKPILQNKQHEHYNETAETLLFVLQQILIIMHPVSPFVSEEIYQTFFAHGDKDLLCNQVWPDWHKDYNHPSHNLTVGFKELVSKVRSLRTTLEVDEKTSLPLLGHKAGTWIDSVIDLAGLVATGEDDPANKKTIAIPTGNETHSTQFVVGLPDDLDMGSMASLLKKKMAQLEKDINITKQKTDNQEFMKRAKQEIKDELQERLIKLTTEQTLISSVEKTLFA